MAATGLILNFYLAGLVSQVALGVFNQIYATYVIAAQIAAFGMQDSAQRHVARYHLEPAESKPAAAIALVIAAIAGICMAALLIAIAPGIGEWTASVEVGRGIFFAAWGLPFFAVNKVLFGALNGQRRMLMFAVGQALRAVFILCICVWIGENDYAYSLFGLCFSVTELLLFPCLATIVGWRNLAQGFTKSTRARWLRSHFGFGLRGLPSGILAEMFIRIDILMLGHFMDDAQVGKYSFAVLFLEGLYQIPVVIRSIVNPMIARAGHIEITSFRRTVRRIAALAGCVTLFVGISLLALFPSLSLIFPADLISDSYLPLKILLIGLMPYALFIPFDYILLQSGRPGAQSIMMGANVSANVTLNFLLIPLYGITGAAIATAASLVFSALTLNLAAWRLLGMRGGILFVRQIPQVAE